MFQSLSEIERFFYKRTKVGIKPGLERVMYLLQKMNHPEKELSIIHVAGTNGKGSTIQFMNQALITNGYRVGVFSSPSFTGLCGYFKINNEEIEKSVLIKLMNELIPTIREMDEQNMQPSEFEIITLLAFLYFKDRTDIVLLEAGMGGREDTTNCVDPLIAVITNVAKDHIHFLGNSLQEITLHKAGIIKQNRPIIVGKVQQGSERIIRKEAQVKEAHVYQLFDEFAFTVDEDGSVRWRGPTGKEVKFSLKLKGDHQIENASLAIMALFLLEANGFEIDWGLVSDSLYRTHIQGRFEKIMEKPAIILDSAHNVDGMKAFLDTVLDTYPKKEKHLLFAGFKDKELEEMLTLLHDLFDEITITTFDHERAATIDELSAYSIGDSLEKAAWKNYVAEIFENKNSDILYFITGSLHFITLVRKWILERKN